jgi:predicted RNA-binding Zn-ribbon protein involved in translation (DUF1610 family)
MDLASELQKIYDSELNVEIGWLWDGNIDVRLGDKMNGFEAEENVGAVEDILPWLQEAIAHFYPQSTYGVSLSPEVHQRAVARIFLPPRQGVRHICPHCGAPNASPVMDESFIYVCARCGNSVEVPRPKVQ